MLSHSRILGRFERDKKLVVLNIFQFDENVRIRGVHLLLKYFSGKIESTRRARLSNFPLVFVLLL